MGIYLLHYPGSDCHRELLHLFNCCGNASRDCRYVPYPTQGLPTRNWQSVGASDWRNSNCHAHCPFCYYGNWGTSLGSTGMHLYNNKTFGVFFLVQSNMRIEYTKSLHTGLGSNYQENDSNWGNGWHGCSLQRQDWDINLKQIDCRQKSHWGRLLLLEVQ